MLPNNAPPVSTRKLLLTPLQAAAGLSTSERTLRSLTANGEVPCVKIGRSVRYRPKTPTAWLVERERKGGGQ